MELNEKTLKNLEENVNGMVNKHVFNNVWKDVVISLISEVRLLRKKHCTELRDEYLQPELDKYKNIKVERNYE